MEECTEQKNDFDTFSHGVIQLQSNLERQKKVLSDLKEQLVPDDEPPLEELTRQREQFTEQIREVLQSNSSMNH